ncbi:hypothetical protein [Bartonella grahamii]|uniref:hypothetical protein n=1 Tax=Bartonella grahamii TaxID=33045 RepID=UPI003AF3E439
MKTYTLADVAVLIDKYEGDIVNFASKDREFDDLVIEKAEEILGLQFTSSYPFKIVCKQFNKRGIDYGYKTLYPL